jgi:hypothetical protein
MTTDTDNDGVQDFKDSSISTPANSYADNTDCSQAQVDMPVSDIL